MSGHHVEPGVEPVHLTVDGMPVDVARQIREFQDSDPEFLRRVLVYGVTYRAVFETLKDSWSV
ncbi:MAG: hypothetical protein LBG44_05835 [Gemmatimonadota bacterium]|nr:hypothetical protein [Gemmatimonadota bacterium]